MSEVNQDVLKKVIPRFRKTLKTDQAEEWMKDRDNKDIFFKRHFGRKPVEEIDEGVLRDLIHNLWSYGGWSDRGKDWILEQMLESGLPQIVEAFEELLYGNKPLPARFNKMRKIKWMGAASISEILAQHDRTKYPIYNRRSKAGLVKLGVDPKILPKSSQINGSQYQSFCNLVQDVFRQIGETYEDIEDLLKLDFLLYYVATVYEEEPSEPQEKYEHSVAVEQVLQLGDSLGFEVKKEFFVTQGCKIDAIWVSRIANLGTIAYAFEVHKGGSRDSVILNLQRCSSDPSIQRVIIVSTENELQRFRGEISSLPENFRESVGYLRIEDLRKSLEYQESLRSILANIGLLESRIGI